MAVGNWTCEVVVKMLEVHFVKIGLVSRSLHRRIISQNLLLGKAFKNILTFISLSGRKKGRTGSNQHDWPT